MMLSERRSLADLPPPSLNIFPLRAPWQPVGARMLTSSLNVDPGLFSYWRMRGIGPVALPPEWTKGRSLTYRIDSALEWLARRQGEEFDRVEVWADHLTAAGLPPDPVWVHRLAERDGPAAYAADGVTFTSAGWCAYLESLKSDLARPA